MLGTDGRLYDSNFDFDGDGKLNAYEYSVGLSTLFQTNFFRLFFRYCTGVWYPKEECMRWWLYQFT